MNRTKNKRGIGAIVVCFIFIMQMASIAQADEKYDRLIQKGDEQLRQFDLQGAYEAYKAVHSLFPDRYEALLKLTRVSNNLGEKYWNTDRQLSECYFRESVGYAGQMHRQFPDSAETYINLATAYGNLALISGGREKVKLARDVETHCQKAIALNPKLGMPYLILGIYYREVANLSWLLKLFAKTLYGGMPGGSYEESAEMLQKAIELMPESIEAHLQLAQTYDKLKQYDKALAHLQIAAELPVKDYNDSAKKALAAALSTQWASKISE